MKIAVVSDSHDNLEAIAAFCRQVKTYSPELILHAGDIVAPFAARAFEAAGVPLKAVFGNNDGERQGLHTAFGTWGAIFEPPLTLTLEGKVVTMLHDEMKLEANLAAESDIVIYGHTHDLAVERRRKTFFLNPGELGGWLSRRFTFALLTLGEGETDIQPMEVNL